MPAQGLLARKSLIVMCGDLDESNQRERTLLGKKSSRYTCITKDVIHQKVLNRNYLQQRGQKIHSNNSHSICRGLFDHHLLMMNID